MCCTLRPQPLVLTVGVPACIFTHPFAQSTPSCSWLRRRTPRCHALRWARCAACAWTAPASLTSTPLLWSERWALQSKRCGVPRQRLGSIRRQGQARHLRHGGSLRATGLVACFAGVTEHVNNYSSNQIRVHSKIGYHGGSISNIKSPSEGRGRGSSCDASDAASLPLLLLPWPETSSSRSCPGC
jgi:hypothetical protein